MTPDRETIIRLAREAGMEAYLKLPAVNALGKSIPVEWLERFATLLLERYKPKPLTDDVKHELVSNYFAEEWAQQKALDMLADFEQSQGITGDAT